jgi:hypothetical protein
MDIFRTLQSSLASQWEQAFDRAYHDLTTEVHARDTRVKQLEKEIEFLLSSRRDDHARIRDLEGRIILLRDDLGGNDTIREEENNTIEQKVSELERTYDPDRLVRSVRNACSDQNNSEFCQALEQLEICYRALCEEVRTLLDVTGSLRAQAKRNKRKIAQWARWHSQENQTVLRDKVGRDHRSFNGGTMEEMANLDSPRNNKSVLLPAQRPTSPSFQRGAPDGEYNTGIPHDQSAASKFRFTKGVTRRSPSLPQSKLCSDSSWPRIERESDDEANSILVSKMLDSEPSSTQSEDSTRDHDDHPSVPIASIPPASTRVSQPKLELPNSHDQWQDEPINIKSEAPPSSPVLNTLFRRDMNPAGTQDLDDVGDSVRTPKKQSFAVFEEGVCPRVEGSMEVVRQQRRVLQPRDNNQKSAEYSCRSSSTKRRKISEGSAAAIPSVTEDGENAQYDPRRKNQYVSSEESLARTPGVSPRNGGAYRRLDDLLQAPSPLQRQLLHQGSTKSPTGLSPNMPEVQNAKPANEPFHVSSSRIASGAESHTGLNLQKGGKAASLQIDNPAREFSQDDETVWEEIIKEVPYRERPIDLLDLGCFRVNPENNEGLNFAFQDVVRKHDQRNCLPGCMRADCCGDKFRAMVRAGGIVQFEEKDRTLLEDYLGDQKHIIDEIDVEARNNLLIEAKARNLADRFGRHKHAHERPRSPPGFWRTDMPSTQELANYRKEADQLEREKIKDRYREAMRPGGRWKFGDE